MIQQNNFKIFPFFLTEEVLSTNTFCMSFIKVRSSVSLILMYFIVIIIIIILLRYFTDWLVFVKILFVQKPSSGHSSFSFT